MRPLDWIVVALYLIMLTAVMFGSRRYISDVTAYLAAGRFAGRYLLAGSSGMMWLGLAVAAAEFEKFYEAGFSAVWWSLIFAPLGYILAASGWINFRFRRTQALTMGQFFEMRYGRSFRIFAGCAMLFAGLLNYGIFPGVSAEIIVSVLGLPRHFAVGAASIPTVPAVVAGLLAVAVGIALFGGFVAILLADFIQSQLFYLTLLAAVGVVIWQLGWHATMRSVFSSAAESRLNPYRPSALTAFDPWFFVLLSLRNVYNYENWPSGQGFMAAAASPHEAKMAGIMGEWRNNLQMFILMALAFCAFALLHSSIGPALTSELQVHSAAVSPAAQSRVLVPATIAAILPAGLLGLFCSVLIGASLARDNTDLLTWGVIFIQDVLLPLRGRPLTPRWHLRVLRLSVLGATVFVLLWSWFFPLRQYVWLYLNLSGSIYLAGSGIVVIGGMYWPRATSAGAWSAMLAGVVLTAIGLILQTAWPHYPWLLAWSAEFPLNGMWIAFWASAAAVIAYFVVSWMGASPTQAAPLPAAARSDWHSRCRAGWSALTGADRIIYGGQLVWSCGIGLICLAVTGWNYSIAPLSSHFWRWWWIGLTSSLALISGITFLWILIGGSKDVAVMLRKLTANRGAKATSGEPEH